MPETLDLLGRLIYKPDKHFRSFAQPHWDAIFLFMNLETFLAQSRADDAFKSAVRAYTPGRLNSRVQSPRSAPMVKVLRVVAQLLSEHPELEVTRVSVDAISGCSDFRGTLRVECNDGVREFEFLWDCRWRAAQAGWTDPFGFPDQIRAAREFGHRCFRTWLERSRQAIAV
jgi:hypothetical protein